MWEARGRETLKQAVVIAIPTSKSQPRQMDGRTRTDGRTSKRRRTGILPARPALPFPLCIRPFCCLTALSHSRCTSLRGRFQKICGRRRHTMLGVVGGLSDSLLFSYFRLNIWHQTCECIRAHGAFFELCQEILLVSTRHDSVLHHSRRRLICLFRNFRSFETPCNS